MSKGSQVSNELGYEHSETVGSGGGASPSISCIYVLSTNIFVFYFKKLKPAAEEEEKVFSSACFWSSHKKLVSFFSPSHDSCHVIILGRPP